MLEINDLFTIVVVNYNSYTETIKLNHSLKSCDIDYRLIVVDNNSDDLNINGLIKEFSDDNRVDVLFLDDNVGYFPALNKGLSLVGEKDRNSSYTIIGNNDLVFNESFFDGLVSGEYDSDIMAISPSVVTINNVYQNPSAAKKPSAYKYYMYSLYYSNFFVGRFILWVWRKLGLGIDTNYIKDTEEREIFIGIGAVYVLLPKFFEKNSKLEYPLFLYGEEAFFSQQLHNTGGRLLYKPDIEVVHLESVSTSKIPSRKNYELNKKAFKVYKSFFK